VGSARIVVFNLNDTRQDPRVRRVAATLVRAGYQVTVCELRHPPLARRDTLDGYEILRVARPQSYTYRDMQGLVRLCEAMGAVLRYCAPEILDYQDNSALAVVWNTVRRLGRWRALQTFFPSAVQARRQLFGTLGEIFAIRAVLLINLALYQAAVRYAPALVYCNDLDTLLAGVLYKIRHGAVLCYDAHEIYPEQYAVHLRSDLWHQFYTRLESRLLPYTDGRVTVCDSLGAYFRETYKAGSFLTVYNTPLRKHLPDETILQRRNQPLRILYHGYYFPYRGLDEIIAIASEIDQARFLFRGMGEHEQTLRAQVAQRQLTHRVQFADPVTADALIPLASQCDIGLSPFISVCRNTEYALPNKFFEYMMAGLALASADLVEMRLLTQQLGNGVLFDAQNPECLAQSLQHLVQDHDRLQTYRRRSYEAAKTRFHWEYEEGKLTAYLRQLVA
jgi:glycosyltransferase involved in cell wall biosynthesis